MWRNNRSACIMRSQSTPYAEKITALTEKGVVGRVLDNKFLHSYRSTKPEDQINLDDYEGGYICALHVLIVIRNHSVDDALQWLSEIETPYQARALDEIFLALQDNNIQCHAPDVIAEIKGITEIYELGAFEEFYIHGLRKSHLLTWKTQTGCKWDVHHSLALGVLIHSFFCDIDSAMGYLLRLPAHFQAQAFNEIIKDNPEITLDEDGFVKVIDELQALTWPQCTAIHRLYCFGLRKEHFDFWNVKHGKEKFNGSIHPHLLFFLIVEKKVDPESAVVFLSRAPDRKHAGALLALLKLDVPLEAAIKELEGLEESENCYLIIERFYQYGLRKEHLLQMQLRAKENFCWFHLKPLEMLLVTKKCDVVNAMDYLYRIFDFDRHTVFVRMMEKDETLSIETLLSELEGLSRIECKTFEELYSFGLRKRHFLLWREKRPDQPFSYRDSNLLCEKVAAQQDQPIDALIVNLLENRPILKERSAFFVLAGKEVMRKMSDNEKKVSFSC